jgi:hypothetical protein
VNVREGSGCTMTDTYGVDDAHYSGAFQNALCSFGYI